MWEMEKNIYKTLTFTSVCIILATTTYVYWPVIFEQYTQIVSDSSGNKSDAKSKKGVRRKISYMGRIREAQKLIEHEYYTVATLELLQAIKEKPDLIEPYLMLGEIYLRTGDVQKLEGLISELTVRFPDSPAILELKIRQLIDEEKFSEVLAQIKGVSVEMPPNLKFYLAVLKALQNNHKVAKEMLHELEVLPVRAQSFMVTKSGVEAKENMEDKQSFITPNLGKKVTALSIVYEEFDELAEGKNPHLFVLIAKVLVENSEARLAREFADTAIKEEVSYIDAWILRGYSNLKMKNFDDALEDLRHAYELDPIRPQTHYFLALALNEAGKDEEAALFFEKALEHQFEFSDEVRWKLVELFSKQKKYDRVMGLYSELLDEDTKKSQYVTALHTMINMAKKPEAALEFTEYLVTKKPNDAFALNMHAWALISNNEYAQAEDILDDAMELDSENSRTHLNYGTLYEALDEIVKAKNHYQKAYEYGKKRSQTTITNLAAKQYNTILGMEKNVSEGVVEGRPEHSP